MAEATIHVPYDDDDSTSSELLFRFGFIADVQYADIPDAFNFDKTMKRYYRGSLDSLREADKWWKKKSSESDKGLSFIANLGDVLDGQNMDTDGGNVRAIGAICEVFARQTYAPFTVHLVGNHELYNFTRDELAKGINIPGENYTYRATMPAEAEPALPACEDPRGLYFAFFPRGAERKYRIVLLDPYDVSCMRDGGGRHGIELYEGHGMHQEGLELLQQHNHNPVGEKRQINFFQGLEGEDGRWVPFNGGIGEEQLGWLRLQLRCAKEDGQRVIILCHVILHPDATPGRSCRTLVWNYQEVLEALREFPGVAPLVLCGHAHTGVRHWDPASRTHHVTCYSPLEYPSSFGLCDVMRDGELRLLGSGAQPSCTLPPDSAHSN